MSFDMYSKEAVNDIAEQGYNAGYNAAMQKVNEAFSKLKKGGFLYKDTDGVVLSIVFSRGYNQAVEEVKTILKELENNEVKK